MRTRRWTRSPKGQLLGVVTGLAEWKGFPIQTTRLLCTLLIIFTSVFPGVLIYLILAMILPMQTSSDWISDEDADRKDSFHFRKKGYEDAEFHEEKSTEDLKKEYENLKKKVETMENDIFDREKDWDNRFKGDN